MKYRLITQHNKSDSEQHVTITECKEAVKQTYLDSCRKDYFTLLERCRCGEWEGQQVKKINSSTTAFQKEIRNKISLVGENVSKLLKDEK